MKRIEGPHFSIPISWNQNVYLLKMPGASKIQITSFDYSWLSASGEIFHTAQAFAEQINWGDRINEFATPEDARDFVLQYRSIAN